MKDILISLFLAALVTTAMLAAGFDLLDAPKTCTTYRMTT